MEVFTLCDCDNITNSYVAHCEQKTNRNRNQKKITLCAWGLTDDAIEKFAGVCVDVTLKICSPLHHDRYKCYFNLENMYATRKNDQRHRPSPFQFERAFSIQEQ